MSATMLIVIRVRIRLVPENAFQGSSINAFVEDAFSLSLTKGGNVTENAIRIVGVGLLLADEMNNLRGAPVLLHALLLPACGIREA